MSYKIVCYGVHEIYAFSLVNMKRSSSPNATRPVIKHYIFRVDTPCVKTANLTQMAPDQRPPETLPEPWLFDTEALIRELNRCRELVLLIPALDLLFRYVVAVKP